MDLIICASTEGSVSVATSVVSVATSAVVASAAGVVVTAGGAVTIIVAHDDEVSLSSATAFAEMTTSTKGSSSVAPLLLGWPL